MRRIDNGGHFNNTLECYDSGISSVIELIRIAGIEALVLGANDIAIAAKEETKMNRKMKLDSFYEKIMKSLALFDGIALFQSPEEYPDWFSGFISQSETEKIMPFTFADQINEQGGFYKLEFWLSRFSPDGRTIL